MTALDDMLEGLVSAMPVRGCASREALELALVTHLSTAMFAIGRSPEALALILMRSELQDTTLAEADGQDSVRARAKMHVSERLRLAARVFDPRSPRAVKVMNAYPETEVSSPLVSVLVSQDGPDAGTALLSDVGQVRRTVRNGETIEDIVFQEGRRASVTITAWATTSETASLLEDVLMALLTIRSESFRAIGITEITSVTVTGVPPHPDMVARVQVTVPMIELSILWEKRLAIRRRNVLTTYTGRGSVRQPA